MTLFHFICALRFLSKSSKHTDHSSHSSSSSTGKVIGGIVVGTGGGVGDGPAVDVNRYQTYISFIEVSGRSSHT